MSTRTYRVTLEARGGKEVTRELPTDYAEAREMAVEMAARNDAWKGSRWSARNGDEFAIDESGNLAELTANMED